MFALKDWFAYLPDQELAVKQLYNILKSKQISHAYIFSGPPGTGKERAAGIFARSLNCYQGITTTPCGTCLACLKLLSGNHPDFIQVEPEENTIKIEQIRHLQTQLLFKNWEGRYKIALIRKADTMTVAAGNSFLKMLEEPKKNTVIILTCENPRALLPTVFSRCQQVSFRKLSQKTLVKNLTDEGCPPEKATILARLADTSLIKAKINVNSDEIWQLREASWQYWKQCSEFPGRDVLLTLADEIASHPDRDVILEWLLLWPRDLLVWKQTRNESLLFNPDKVTELEKFTDRGVSLTKIVDRILKTQSLLQKNINARLALEVLFLEIGTLLTPQEGGTAHG